MKSHEERDKNAPPGIGKIKTNGMICTCQGSACSCIGASDAHCVWEEDEQCIEPEALVHNGICKRI